MTTPLFTLMCDNVFYTIWDPDWSIILLGSFGQNEAVTSLFWVLLVSIRNAGCKLQKTQLDMPKAEFMDSAEVVDFRHSLI